ncbi:MAG: DUF294 nucleotidyltransferase-like domain-containing protein [Deferribacteraceae bacterium]|jgi:CBS domain-containing protein|nr:DUF294 nucleotidyltransferase-like domain-containing protein [Deferribacteraceae bacterium]
MQRKFVSTSPTLLENLKRLFIFRDIPDDILAECLQNVEELHLLKDELIFRRGESYHKGIYFVLSGGVEMKADSEKLYVAPGDAVGIATFLGKTMYTVTAVADVDSDIVLIDEYSLYSLMDKAPGFRERFMKVILERLNNLERIISRMMSLSAYQSVGSCMRAPLITIHNSKSIADAAKLMQEHKIGALVIMNRKHVLKGLLTSKHLAQRYLSNATESPNKALAEKYANPTPLLLPQEYPLVETLAEMLCRGEDYALITRKNKPAGIISKSDITVLLSNGSDVFSASVSRAHNIDELLVIKNTFPKILENMMNNTSLFRELLPTLSTNHLIIQKRAFELAKQAYRRLYKFELFAGDFCFLSNESLARREGSLCLDQANVLILSDNVTNSQKAHYVTFAAMFANMLRNLGYGDNSRGLSLNNPKMVKSIGEWRDYISTLIHKSDENNIPCTRVLFDCEKFEGNELLAWEFKDAIYETVKEKTLFFGRLVNYQSMAKIPMSQFGSFITEKEGEYEGTIDLRENALDFITYTAQAFAINADILDTNTVRRLEHLGRKKIVSENLVRETISAYESLVDLILHEQLAKITKGIEPSFRIKPTNISMHSQEQLKRALNIAAHFFGEGLAYFR